MSDQKLPKKMNRRDALTELKRINIQMRCDPESAHFYADRVLMALLLDFGCRAVVNEFNSIKKYYA